MAYSGTYAAADMDDIAIDGIGTIGVAIVGLASIVGLVFLYRWFKKKAK